MSGKSTRILCISLTVLLLSGVACRLSAPKESSLIVDADITEPSPIPTSTTTKIPPTAEPNDPMLHQWAVSAVDKYDSGMADNVTGEPDAEGCEITFAGSMWNYESELSAYHDAKAYLQLFYAEPVLPTEVNIYLAYVHSAIVKVSLLDLEGKPHQIYQDEPNYPDECPSVISIKIDHLSVPVYSVRIDLDTLDPDIYEITAIDAVELVGAPLTVHQPTPVPTPYLTISSLGFNASNVPEGFVYFEVFDNNFDISLTHTECDAFSFNISETERTIRFFSCDDSTELWLYLLPDEPIQSTPLNT